MIPLSSISQRLRPLLILVMSVFAVLSLTSCNWFDGETTVNVESPPASSESAAAPAPAPSMATVPPYDPERDGLSFPTEADYIAFHTPPEPIHDESYDPKRIHAEFPEHLENPTESRHLRGEVENLFWVDLNVFSADRTLYNRLKQKADFKAYIESVIGLPVTIRTRPDESTNWLIEVMEGDRMKLDSALDTINRVSAEPGSYEEQTDRILGGAMRLFDVMPGYEAQFEELRSKEPRRHIPLAVPPYEEDPLFSASGTSPVVVSSGSTDAGWYWTYMGMDALRSYLITERGANGVNVLKSSIGVGIIDGDVNYLHEDIARDRLRWVNPRAVSVKGAQDAAHGTAVLATASGALTGNRLGTRSVIEANTAYGSYEEFDKGEAIFKDENTYFRKFRELIDDIVTDAYQPRVVNMSWALDSSFAGLDKDFDRAQFRSHMQRMREVFSGYPNVLFVLAAGNSGIDAIDNNGAIHLNKRGDYSPLPNVIVVGAVGADDYLQSYSDFGRTVDIVAPAGFITPGCAQYRADGTTTSYYKRRVPSLIYGVSRGTESSIRSPSCSDDGEFDGTSSAAPLTMGTVGLLFSVDPSLSAASAKEILISSSDRRTKGRWSSGATVDFTESTSRTPVINAFKAYQQAEKVSETADITVSTDRISLTIADVNGVQDEFFDLYLSGKKVGEIRNQRGGSTTIGPVTLSRRGRNPFELRIVNKEISDTYFEMTISPDGITYPFGGDDISYAFSIRVAPWLLV